MAILRAIAEYEVKPQRVIIEAVFDKMMSTVANRFTAMGLPAFPGTQILIFWGVSSTAIQDSGIIRLIMPRRWNVQS